MKIRNIKLINFDGTLSKYADMRLPQKISYAITKNMIVISNELDTYRKALKKIIDNYEEFQVKDENGNVENLPIGIPKVDDAHIKDYLGEIDDLLNVETEVNIHTIPEDVFDYPDSDKYDPMTAADIIALQQILCD